MKSRKMLFFTIFFCLISFACAAQSSPSDVVKKFYKSYYDRNASAFSACITPGDMAFITKTFGEEGLSLFLNMFMGAMSGMSQDDLSSFKNIRILSEEIDGDKATVRVAVNGASPLNLVKIQGAWKIDLGLSNISNLFQF